MAVGFDDLGRLCVAMGVGGGGMDVDFDRDDRRRVVLKRDCILLIVYMI